MNPPATDNFLGYGFQIWLCKPEGAYRADGAMGQFTIVLPKLDMIIAITETAPGAHWAQRTLDITWDFTARVTDASPLPEDPAAFARLQAKLGSLNVGNPPCQPYSPMIGRISGKTFRMTSGVFGPFGGNFMSGEGPDPVREFSFDFDNYGCLWRIVTASGREEYIRVGTGGLRLTNILGTSTASTQLYLAHGSWPAEDTFELRCRWVETCLEDIYTLKFEGNKVSITASNNSPFQFGGQRPAITAEMA